MKINNIKNRNDLAICLGIKLKYLTYILYKKNPNNLYSSFKIPKKSGGFRTIDKPDNDLKYIQKKLSNELKIVSVEILKNSNISHAFQQNKSILTNAQVHVRKKFVLNMDLENFFNSFNFGRVKGFFEKNRNFNLPPEMAIIIAQLTCYNGTLPQGSPSSPIITNLICQILDFHLLKIAKKYKLDYTRYADDLTFSTNDKKFVYFKSNFINDIRIEINKSGFKLNEKKTRLCYRNSEQEVTGIIVNEKVNIQRNFYRITRSMAHSQYKYGYFFKENGEKGTLNYLMGRFSFIDQIDKFNHEKSINNKKESIAKRFYSFNGHEKQYQKFIFYKNFLVNENPLIVTEGKTDIIYLKSALKKLCLENPNKYRHIIEYKDDRYQFHISFLNRTDKLDYFLGITNGGADSFVNIYNFYSGNKNFPNFDDYFKKISDIKRKRHPLILLFDNEQSKKDNKRKPLAIFKNKISLNQTISKPINLKSNLFILPIPLTNSNSKDIDIEGLFNKNDLSYKLNGKSFDRYTSDISQNYGKAILANHVAHNYMNINFENFEPLFEEINEIILKFEK